MYTQGFGEVLTDILTVDPNLRSIASVSSILDTSNYTFNAVTYGKDHEGFNFHGHSISSTQYVDGNSSNPVSGYNDGILIAVNYPGSVETSAIYSYHFSSVYENFSSTYNSISRYPAVNDLRLELGSTKTTNASSYQYASALPDLGHYPNAAVDPDLSSIWNVVGVFPPSGEVAKYSLFSSVDGVPTFICSSVMSGGYNTNGVVEKNGFVKINESTGIGNALSTSEHPGQGGALVNGPCIFSSTDSISRGRVQLAVVAQLGDAAALALFGGVTHFGVWCLDFKAMLASGLTPPYSWNNLNNNRKYKLVAKVSFWENLMRNFDYSFPGQVISYPSIGNIGVSAFNFSGVETLNKNLLLTATLDSDSGSLAGNLTFTDSGYVNKGPLFQLLFNFT